MSTDAAAQPRMFVASEDANRDTMVRRAQADPAAFREIYQAYFPRVYRYVVAQTQSIADAEDVTSATFVKALGSLHQYGWRGSFDAWLFRIARNCLRDHVHEERFQAHEAFPADAALRGHDDTEGEVLGRLRAQELYHRLDLLPRAQYQVLSLMILADLRPHEVAEVLGKRDGTVRGLLHRALRTLRERLHDD